MQTELITAGNIPKRGGGRRAGTSDGWGGFFRSLARHATYGMTRPRLALHSLVWHRLGAEWTRDFRIATDDTTGKERLNGMQGGEGIDSNATANEHLSLLYPTLLGKLIQILIPSQR